MRIRYLVMSIVLGVGFLSPVHAAEPASADPVLMEASELPGLVMFANSGAPGLVLVVVRGDRHMVLGYGETERGNKRTPDGNSLVRLNSVTKVVATEVLVSLAAEGKLRLSDPLQRYAGQVQVPAFDGHPITLLDLATHAGALPREMGDEPPGMAPRTWPTRADRWAWLAKYKLPWAPGTIAAYSNVGFDLLADAMETAAGEPYAVLLKERVTDRLGMADTVFAPSPEQCARLMVGSGLGGVGPCVDTHATGGSGGLYSTGNDMARWLRHNMDESDSVLAVTHAAYRPRQGLMAAIGFDEAGPMAALGLGWVITAGEGSHPTILAKSGGGVGFMTYIAFAPGRHVGVFVAVNRADFGMFAGLTEVANGIIASLSTR